MFQILFNIRTTRIVTSFLLWDRILQLLPQTYAVWERCQLITFISPSFITRNDPFQEFGSLIVVPLQKN